MCLNTDHAFFKRSISGCPPLTLLAPSVCEQSARCLPHVSYSYTINHTCPDGDFIPGFYQSESDSHALPCMSAYFSPHTMAPLMLPSPPSLVTADANGWDVLGPPHRPTEGCSVCVQAAW